jgi:opacity protein-like surface antigen
MTTITHSSTRKFGLSLIAAVVAASIASPALAESAYSPDVSAKSHHARKHSAPSAQIRGRAAYGSAQTGGFDSNNPEMTGGGSIGYNRKLLEF